MDDGADDDSHVGRLRRKGQLSRDDVIYQNELGGRQTAGRSREGKGFSVATARCLQVAKDGAAAAPAGNGCSR